MLLLVTVSAVIAVISIAVVALWVGGEKGYHFKGRGTLMFDDVCKIVSWYGGRVEISAILAEDIVQAYYDFRSPIENEFGLVCEEYHKVNFVNILLLVFVMAIGILAIAYSAILTFKN